MKKNIVIIFLILIIITMSQLKKPLDKQSQNIIEQTVDKFLEDKIHKILWKRTFHYSTFFESLDGFGTSGTVTVDKDDVLLTTGAVSGNVSNIKKQPAWQGLISFSLKSYFRTTVSLGSVANVTEYIIVGSLDGGSYYGFKIVNATLYGVSYDGTTESTKELKTITASNYNLEARLLPRNKIVFFVEAAEHGTLYDNLPLLSSTPNIKLFEFNVTTNEDVAKTMQLSYFEYLQARNVLK